MKENNVDCSSASQNITSVDFARRKTLGAIGTWGLLSGVVSCGGSGGNNAVASSTGNSLSSSTSSSTSSSSATGSCVLIPSETQGPYPLTAILSNSAIFRADITEGKTGVPLTLKLRLVNINSDCSPFTYASIYVWHCDKDGVYSGYAQPGVNTVGETFCRGVQDVNENGEVVFTTIYPGWYTGRITHIHFQSFLYNDTSTSASVTSQLAFPEDITRDVYNSDLYNEHGQNTSVSSFAADNVFSDGVTYQIASVTGSVSEGYVATLDVGIAV